MRARPMWVLVVLAAVFAMHGLPVMAAGSGHPETGTHHVQTPAATGDAASDVLPVASDGHPSGAAGMAGPGSAPAGQESPSSGVAHAWAACLAVVATGFTVLGALFLVRAVTPSAGRGGALDRPRSRSVRVHPLRPPDLAVLCLLRI